jgi:hypothetical protein
MHTEFVESGEIRQAPYRGVGSVRSDDEAITRSLICI